MSSSSERADHDPADPSSRHDPDEHQGHAHGGGLNAMAVMATLHCMTGCLIGEVVGMAIAEALGFPSGAQIALAIVLAFLFGYALTSRPLLRSGLALGAVIPIALAVDTVSITTMEIVDNLTVVVIPGAMDAGLADLLFWSSMLGGFVVAFPFALWVNRWLLQRGKGHALVHEFHAH